VFHRGSFGDFEWARDGGAIVYTVEGRILLRELPTGRETVLYRAIPPSTVGDMALSSDGKWLAFVRTLSDGETWTQILTVMAFAGGPPRELMRLNKPDASRLETWTADGKALLFTRWTQGRDADRRELWRMPVEVGEAQSSGLAMDGLREVRAHPDGRRVAFTAGWSSFEIWALENFLP
jgi:dipeptidyl aminopeptidase/acylaminoacyl peptidase